MAWQDPATDYQIRSITRLAIALGLREPIEENRMTRAEARKVIYDLSGELRARARKNGAGAKDKWL